LALQGGRQSNAAAPPVRGLRIGSAFLASCFGRFDSVGSM
jgi:hypothetical protein